jgi:hypothetical protein
LSALQIGQTSGQFQLPDNHALEIMQTSAQSYETDPDLLLNHLSFSHITLTGFDVRRLKPQKNREKFDQPFHSIPLQ